MATELERDITAIVADITEMDEQELWDNRDKHFMEELDIDSMLALEIIAMIEKNYRIEIEEERAASQCTIIESRADYHYDIQTVTHSLEAAITSSRGDIRKINRVIQQAGVLADMSKCSIIMGLSTGGDCFTAAAASLIVLLLMIILHIFGLKWADSIPSVVASAR